MIAVIAPFATHATKSKDRKRLQSEIVQKATPWSSNESAIFDRGQ
jgi:hypothetical protein